MWIQCNRTHDDGRLITTSLKTEYMDESVDFSDEGTVQVTKDVGEQLIEDFDFIEDFTNERNTE